MTEEQLKRKPVHMKNTTIIMNRNSVYYVMDYNETKHIQIIPKKHIEECKHLERKTFRNSLTTTAMYRGDDCWNSIIFRANASLCQYKIIPNDNYFIPLGKKRHISVCHSTYICKNGVQ